MRTFPKILTSLLVTGVVASSALLFSSAFFSDTETSTGNTFQAGTLDLLIDNTSYYNGQSNPGTSWTLENLGGDPGHLFFNFNDLKPGDWGEDTISLHVQNDAWACMKITTTEDDDKSCTEPEKINDPACADPGPGLLDGELGSQVAFIWWADDGDNVLETNENPQWKTGLAKDLFNGTIWPLADSGISIWSSTPAPIPGDQTVYIGKAWCFGKLGLAQVPEGQGVNPSVASGITCDGTNVNNAAQSDSFKADVEFTAIQSRHNPGYLCNPEPTPIPCQPGYATASDASDQGRRKDGTAVTADRSVASYAFGAPQTTGTPYDSVTPNSFFALGFPTVSPLRTASIVLSFGGTVYNQTGDDLKVFEVTGGTSYPDEKIKVEVSNDLLNWSLVSASATRDAGLDLGSVPSFKYLKLTDVSDINLFESTADGYDLDAVQVNCVVPN